MLAGHLAVAFVGKRIEPKLSLGTLVLAAMLPDILWPIFSIAGIEYVAAKPEVTEIGFFEVPFSHSLLMVAIWAALLAGAYFLRRHYRRGALIVLLLYGSPTSSPVLRPPRP
jgi:hypothetical protein